MADPPPDPDTSDDSGATVGPPLWAKVFGVIALVLVLVFVVLLAIGSGHGPGRHTSSDLTEHCV